MATSGWHFDTRTREMRHESGLVVVIGYDGSVQDIGALPKGFPTKRLGELTREAERLWPKHSTVEAAQKGVVARDQQGPNASGGPRRARPTLSLKRRRSEDESG